MQRPSLTVLLVVSWLASAAAAQVVLDQGASIIVLPKIVVDSTHETLVQLSNTSNNSIHADCFYINPISLGFVETDFSIMLAKQQPAFWLASQGRLPSNALPGQVNNIVPPVTAPFQGYMMCVQTDASGAPISGNSLTGQETLTEIATGDSAKYHAIGFVGNFNNDGDNTLCLGGDVSPSCPNGAEYSGCPQTWIMDHFAGGASDSVVGPGSAVRTNLTLIACSIDLLNVAPVPATANFRIVNQFAQSFSASTTVTTWIDTPLDAISPVFGSSTLSTDYAQTRISSVAQNAGILAAAQEFHDSGPPTSLTASTALNLHPQGQGAGQDLIVLPPIAPPFQGFVPPTMAAGLADITAGPDGNLWFTESSADQIGRIPPSGSPIEEFAVPTAGAAPAAITKGPDGNLWFTEENANQVGRISTDGSTIQEFPISAAAGSITSGPDTNVWFTEPSTNTIGRMTVDGSTLKEFPLPAGAPEPTSITLGPDGNLWFTQDGGGVSPDAVGRITPDGGTITEFNIATPVSSPNSITLGSDGNLWFVEAGANQIGRITPAGVISEFAALASPTAIAAAGDGNLWFTTGQSFLGTPCVLGRITPGGVVAAFFQACGSAITGGPDGNVWFLTQDDSIVRFSP
jgi:streptogramin lyase